MIFCNNDLLKIETDIKPVITARTILPSMTKEEIKDIKNKPFINLKNVNFFILDKRYDEEYRIFIPKGYTTDIATIPNGIQWLFGGKSNPYFIICATLHDKLTENPYLINYDRLLSSLVFREILIACGYNKIKAYIMFYAIETFQKTQSKWAK